MPEIADKLLEARETMNSRGRHWIKGALRRKRKTPSGELTSEWAYCSIGSINKVGDRSIRGRLIKALNAGLPNGYRAVGYNGKEPSIKACEGAIIKFNDSYHTKWGDISRAFRRAARLAAQDDA